MSARKPDDEYARTQVLPPKSEPDDLDTEATAVLDEDAVRELQRDPRQPQSGKNR